MSSKVKKLGLNLSIIGKSLKSKTTFDSHKNNQYLNSGNWDSPVANQSIFWTLSGMIGQTPGPVITKSCSMGSINNETIEGSVSTGEHDEIISLTQDVKNFLETLEKLKNVFTEITETGEDAKVTAHERLSEVICVLKGILKKYLSVHESTDLYSTVRDLIAKIKNHNYENLLEENNSTDVCASIDQLALTFSSRVSEYLMDENENSFDPGYKTKSVDNLMILGKEKGFQVEVDSKQYAQMSPEEIDATLSRLDAGVDLGLQRAKAWSKYAKEIISYVERKAQLEAEYAKNLSRLAQSMRPILTDECFLPLQSVYCTALVQDVEYSTTRQATLNLLQTQKFIEPLSSRRSEHDKVRKSVKETWSKEMKKMQDAITNLKKAQSMYITRQQEHEKAKELAQKSEQELMSQSGTGTLTASKVDKKKKLEEEALYKAADAETTYKACVAEANYRQCQLEKVKAELLAKLREQIFLSEQMMKQVTVDYFQLLQAVSAPIPIQCHTLCETSRQYEPGVQYGEFVRRLPIPSVSSANTEPYTFEPYVPQRDADGRKGSANSNLSEHETSPHLSLRKDKYRVPLKAWGQNILACENDSNGGSCKSLDSSPNGSPRQGGRVPFTSSKSFDEMSEEMVLEEEAKMKKMLTLGSEFLDIQGILKKTDGRRNTTFGVDFQEQVKECKSPVPPIVTKCLTAIEKIGMTMKGIYRVSGVRSKVESLCQKFENNPGSINLDDQHPNVISNVLKQYFRQLPEPLLTFRLYPNFIQLAKENLAGTLNGEQSIERLFSIVQQLPSSNYQTLAVLMHHLQRVASHASENQMTASNLGIVFAPTLLRPQEGTASLSALVDTPHQTRTIELLIAAAQTIFGNSRDYNLVPDDTPVEEIPYITPKTTDSSNSAKTTESPDYLEMKPIFPSPTSRSDTVEDEKRLSERTDLKLSLSSDFSLPGSTLYDKKESPSTCSMEGPQSPRERCRAKSKTVTFSLGEDDSEDMTEKGLNSLLSTQKRIESELSDRKVLYPYHKLHDTVPNTYGTSISQSFTEEFVTSLPEISFNAIEGNIIVSSPVTVIISPPPADEEDQLEEKEILKTDYYDQKKPLQNGTDRVRFKMCSDEAANSKNLECNVTSKPNDNISTPSLPKTSDLSQPGSKVNNGISQTFSKSTPQTLFCDKKQSNRPPCLPSSSVSLAISASICAAAGTVLPAAVPATPPTPPKFIPPPSPPPKSASTPVSPLTLRATPPSSPRAEPAVKATPPSSPRVEPALKTTLSHVFPGVFSEQRDETSSIFAFSGKPSQEPVSPSVLPAEQAGNEVQTFFFGKPEKKLSDSLIEPVASTMSTPPRTSPSASLDSSLLISTPYSPPKCIASSTPASSVDAFKQMLPQPPKSMIISSPPLVPKLQTTPMSNNLPPVSPQLITSGSETKSVFTPANTNSALSSKQDLSLPLKPASSTYVRSSSSPTKSPTKSGINPPSKSATVPKCGSTPPKSATTPPKYANTQARSGTNSPSKFDLPTASKPELTSKSESATSVDKEAPSRMKESVTPPKGGLRSKPLTLPLKQTDSTSDRPKDLNLDLNSPTRSTVSSLQKAKRDKTASSVKQGSTTRQPAKYTRTNSPRATTPISSHPGTCSRALRSLQSSGTAATSTHKSTGRPVPSVSTTLASCKTTAPIPLGKLTRTASASTSSTSTATTVTTATAPGGIRCGVTLTKRHSYPYGICRPGSTPTTTVTLARPMSMIGPDTSSCGISKERPVSSTQPTEKTLSVVSAEANQGEAEVSQPGAIPPSTSRAVTAARPHIGMSALQSSARRHHERCQDKQGGPNSQKKADKSEGRGRKPFYV